MAVCANCSRALQPEWKFCIYCGTPTGAGLPATAPATTVSPDAGPDSDDDPLDDAVTEHTSPVLRAEDIPADDDPETASAANAASDSLPRVNILAVLALILGCLISPLAALFGHLALTQISRSGERGTAIAWVAIVLGYLSLAALLVLGISYLVLNA